MSKKAVKSELTKPAEFDEIVDLIEAARTRAVAAVNTTLIDLYWSIGEYISRKIASAAWGEGVVDQLATHIARTHPGLRGYTRSNLLRMRQFYETYRGNSIVAPLVRQLRQLLPAPTERFDTSIAHRAMSMIHPTSQGLKDRWIVCMAETSPPPSIGLSDLMIDLARFVALRATLISNRSVGATSTRI